MDDASDKTEAPTLSRRADARRDGNLALSAELTAAVMCLLAAVVLQQTGAMVFAALRTLLIEGLQASSSLTAGRVGYLLLKALTPLLVLLMLAAVAVNVAQTQFWIGWRRETGVLDATKGVKRLFGRRTGFALLMNIVKLCVVALVTFVTVRSKLGLLVSLQSSPVDELLATGLDVVLTLAIRVSIVFIVLGVIDYLFQRRALELDLRMTRREIRDELRRQEGDAELKRRRKAMWQST